MMLTNSGEQRNTWATWSISNTPACAALSAISRNSLLARASSRALAISDTGLALP